VVTSPRDRSGATVPSCSTRPALDGVWWFCAGELVTICISLQWLKFILHRGGI